MTEAPERLPAPLDDIGDAFRTLRDSGRRVTLGVRMVLEVLFAAEDPLPAEAVAQRAGLDGDLSSVYRNLERLQQVGIVSHVHAGHGPGLYALARGRDREYLVCDRCRRLTLAQPGDLDAVRERLHDEFGYTADFSHFPIHGLCRDCAG
jgi:Fur family transcriptional regulator, ferric uptake regulator